MRVLIAPDKFRGTLTASQAASAIAAGWARARPQDALELVPLADGGEGTLDVLVPRNEPDAERRVVEVRGPLGDPIEAEFGLRGGTGVIESARASGLGVPGERRRAPLRTSTRGTGELMRAALEAGSSELLVCLGGSATNDGGAGMARALGVRLLTEDGRDLDEGGGALIGLARIDATGVDPRLARCSVIGLRDVDNPLCGPNGASAVFGPQKGASPDDVVLLDRALAHLAAVAQRDLGVDLKDEPGAGAAGGLGFGLLAFCGAHLRRGIDVVMDAVSFESRLAHADLVVTGEGSFDTQTAGGKVPAGVLRTAELARVPTAVLCGRATIRPAGVPVRSMFEVVGEARAMSEPRPSLERAAQMLAGEIGVPAA
jgi:glycerate kinase